MVIISNNRIKDHPCDFFNKKINGEYIYVQISDIDGIEISYGEENTKNILTEFYYKPLPSAALGDVTNYDGIIFSKIDYINNKLSDQNLSKNLKLILNSTFYLMLIPYSEKLQYDQILQNITNYY